MENCDAESEYFMMRSFGLRFTNVRMKGKYSFQYIKDSVFEDCTFDTKDAFWHAKKCYRTKLHSEGRCRLRLRINRSLLCLLGMVVFLQLLF